MELPDGDFNRQTPSVKAPEIESPELESSGPCLLAGLRALQMGQDPLLAGLEHGRSSLTARAALWRSSRDHGRSALSADGISRRCGELPDFISEQWLADAPLGRARLIPQSRLNRDPRARSRGPHWIIVARSRAGASLWVESQWPMQWSSEMASTMLTALDHLDDLSSLRQQQETHDRLVRLGERAGGVAHDLRNQLNLARLLLEKSELTQGSSQVELADAIRTAAELCQDFLLDGVVGQRRTTDLGELIRAEALSTIPLSGRVGEVRVVTKCQAGLRWSFDQRPTSRILRNLMLNAIAASPNGGTVRVEVRGREHEGIDLTVQDQGRGMDRLELQRFIQSGQSSRGTGFGTTSILACAESLGAELHIESQKLVGTTVRVRFPSAQVLRS